jgi:hypothetical protein
MKYIKLFEGWDEQEMDSQMEAPADMETQMEAPMDTPEDMEDMDQEAAPAMTGAGGNSYSEIKSFLDNLIDQNQSGEISSEEAFDTIQKEL